MRARLLHADGRNVPINELTQISELLETTENSFIWADVEDPEADDFDLLRREFQLHPLAIEDAVKAHQRSKIEEYDNFSFIVIHGIHTNDAGDVVTSEASVFAGSRFVVTCRHGAVFPVEEVERRFAALKDLRRDAGALVYTILDTIVDNYVPTVQRFEQRTEALEGRMLRLGGRDTLNNDALLRILQIRKALHVMRHLVAPVHDILVHIARDGDRFFSPDEMPYYQDVGDHVLRVLSQIDLLNESIATSLSINVSLAANRQAQVSRQLTIIATIFLPLSFITGFFGQNFGYLVRHIDSEPAFWYFGVLTQLLTVAGLLLYFARRRWI